MECYSVTDWTKLFENNRTRELKHLTWVRIPNKHDGDGYTELMSHKNGPELFAAWILILEVASKCDPRGKLLRSRGVAHNSESLARVTRAPKKIFDHAFPVLRAIGWLRMDGEVVEGEGDTANTGSIPQSPAEKPHPPALKGREGKEGKGIEWNEVKVAWNDLASKHSFAQIQRLTKTRQDHYRIRIEAWPDLWEILAREIPLFDEFVQKGNWFGFDWWVGSDTNFAKLAEGNYRKPGAEPPPKYESGL